MTIARECRPQDSVFTPTSAGAVRSSSRIPAAVRRTRTPGGQPIVISPRILRPDRVAAHQMVSGTHQRCALGGIERRPGSLSKQPWISRRPTARQRRCHRLVTSKCEFGELAGGGLRRFLGGRADLRVIAGQRNSAPCTTGGQGRRQMIRHLMRVRSAAASHRLIFFADGGRLVVAARFCSACWQSRHTAGRPPRLSEACLVRSRYSRRPPPRSHR